MGLEPVNTRLPVTPSNHYAIAPNAPVEKIIQSDLSDSCTKLSMLIWAMCGVLVSRFVYIFLNKIDKMDSKICFEMIFVVVEAIRE